MKVGGLSRVRRGNFPASLFPFQDRDRKLSQNRCQIRGRDHLARESISPIPRGSFRKPESRISPDLSDGELLGSGQDRRQPRNHAQNPSLTIGARKRNDVLPESSGRDDGDVTP